MTEFITNIFTHSLVLQVLSLLKATWFVWVPIILGLLFWELWMLYIQMYYLTNLEWVLLEVKIPRDIFKSPRAMEVVFSVLHNTYSGDRRKKYWHGFVKSYLSFEIASIGGNLKFFVRAPKAFRNMVEAQIYAQYPNTEISEVDDYVRLVPENIPNEDWKLWGGEFVLTKEDAYPIKTYVDFKLEDAKEEEEKIDPMLSLLEFMGSVKEGEHVWAQFIIRATDDKWVKEGEKLKEKIMGKTMPSKGKEGVFFLSLSPGEQEILKALERNMGKLGFDTGIRIMYLARRDMFNFVNVASVNGIMKQYNTLDLNGFKIGKNTTGGFLFEKRREYRNQRVMIRAYRRRGYFYPPFKRKSFVLTSEELATVYHYPGMVATTPTFERTKRKTGVPPANLPI